MYQEQQIKRKQIRLKEYDYSQEGYYYITICTKNRMKILSKIEYQNNVGGALLGDPKIYNEKNIQNIVGADASVRPKQNNEQIDIKLTNIGKIIEESLMFINKIHKNVFVDDYIIMPNHIHLIIRIYGRTEASAPTKNNTRI